MEIEILKCDFESILHCNALVDLMNKYKSDKMGDGKSYSAKEEMDLITGLRKQTNVLSLLAVIENDFVGLTNSFVNFGTFHARLFLNIHDVIVANTYRGKGIGRKLLSENIRIAREELNCSKITLEVREDNIVAQQLYRSLGFVNTHPPMLFWAKQL